MPTSPPGAQRTQSDAPKTGGRAALGSFGRYLRLRYTKNISRRARHLHDNDVVALSERKTDEAVSRGFRLFLKSAGLSSYRLPTRFGLMHCYDSAPDSQEKPIVFLHGIGSSGQCFSWLALMLKDKRRVVCPDLFHFCGFSEPNNPVMDLSAHVDSVREFLDALGVGPVDFVGLSLGGWIGMKLAAGSPERISTLTLLNPAGLRLRPYALRDTITHLSWKKFVVLYPGLLRAFPYTGVPLVSAVLRRSLYRVLRDDAVRDFVKTVHTPDFVDELLGDIKARTLLLWGREDRLISEGAPVTLASGIPSCEAFYVERCAHILCLEAPLNVYDSLCRFLALEGTPENRFTSLLRKTAAVFPQHPISKDGTV